jgi:hypothetical protein
MGHMVCDSNKRAERGRARGDGPVGVNRRRELSDEAQRCLVVLPRVVPLAIEEELTSRRLAPPEAGSARVSTS